MAWSLGSLWRRRAPEPVEDEIDRGLRAAMTRTMSETALMRGERPTDVAELKHRIEATALEGHRLMTGGS